MSTRLIFAQHAAAPSSPPRKRRLLAWLAVACLLLATGPAVAVFHLMKIVEVYTGSAAAPNAHYVVLQMFASGQNLVSGHPLTLYNAAGVQIATATFPGNVPNGANQARILIATPEARAFFNVQPDLLMSAALMRAGGKVCFDTIDCVAWGAYTGSPSGVGTAFNAASGIPLGRAMTRRLDISGGTTVLDAGDDTNNCANDFISAIPIPRNNAGVVGAPPASTCGNNVIESLEQCDDGNTNSGDGCSSTCLIDTPVAALSVANMSVIEGNSGTKIANFIVQLSQASPSPVRYSIATANGTATAGSDYVARSLAGETIPAGQTSRAFAVTINGDLVRESNETLLANVTSVRGARVADAQGQGTIINDDDPMISIGDVVVAEGNSGTRLATFVVRLSQPSTTAITYTITTSNGTATAGSDYVARTLVGETLAPGQTTRSFNVVVNGDTAAEANETFVATVSSASVSISDGTGSATILNDDGAILSVADALLSEGNSGTQAANFTVRLSQATSTPVTYTITTGNLTAVAGSDYVSRTLTDTFPAGVVARNFAVGVVGDAAAEPNEKFVVNLTSSSGATIFDRQGVGSIINDDGPTLSIFDVAVIEGNSSVRTATFTLRLSQPAATPVSYTVATANGNAVAGSDYVARTFIDAIPAGSTSRGFNVTVNGDTAIEANEVFLGAITASNGATIFDGLANGIILNDDGPTLSVGDMASIEGPSGTRAFTFVVRLSRAATVPVTYTVSTLNGTALAGSDYVARSLVDTIPAGQTSRAFVVAVNGDAAVESNEVFFARLSNATGATILDSTATATIINDDGPTLSIADVSTVEGDSGSHLLTFTVRLSQAAANPVSYTVFTGNSSALAGSDYIARQLTGEVIAAGQTTRAFQVTILGDTLVEPTEDFRAHLSAATGTTILDGSAVGQIVNDDP